MGERRDEMRCIVHVDLDCFYVQVERSKNPELKDVPCAVVQYNKWQGGGIIALSYEAKAAGVKRSVRYEFRLFTLSSINTRHSYDRCVDRTPRKSVQISDL